MPDTNKIINLYLVCVRIQSQPLAAVEIDNTTILLADAPQAPKQPANRKSAIHGESGKSLNYPNGATGRKERERAFYIKGVELLCSSVVAPQRDAAQRIIAHH